MGDPDAAIVEVARCGSHYLVFSWAFHGGTGTTNVWRTNVDGTHRVKLTDGENDRSPVCSVDGKWAYYWNVPLQQLWRVPVDGSGKPEGFPRSAVPRTVPAELGLSPSPMASY